MGAAVLVLVAVIATGVAGAFLAMEYFSARASRRRKEAVRSALGVSQAQATASRKGRPLPALPFLSGRRGRPKSRDIARDLPELLDVVRLGIEGGMSFEASFSLYVERFDTDLARACRPAARLMATGVEGKEVVLRELSDELGSTGFRRFAGAVARSSTYGARLAPALADLAREQRETMRADREEAVAKAPTKMLLPTGVFILPAMLMLVAGPFLLELLEQM